MEVLRKAGVPYADPETVLPCGDVAPEPAYMREVIGDDGVAGGKIEYDLVVPSASRPHLLGPTLESLLANLDQLPRKVYVHDDAAFPDRQSKVIEVVQEACAAVGVAHELKLTNPPVYHGAALHWLLGKAQGEFVLYQQDDFLTLRPVPVRRCLALMRKHALHHVRFNKRETMEMKGSFRKLPIAFDGQILSVSDHWYFQLNLGRRARLKTVVDWWMAYDAQAFREHMEPKMNHIFNRRIPQFNRDFKGTDFGLPPTEVQCMDPEIRREFQRTFIWGPPGTPAYIKHIGHLPEDWAEVRPRGGVVGAGRSRDSQADG